MQNKPKAHAIAVHDFAFSSGELAQLADAAVKHAHKLGASDAAAEASEACGLSVGVRMGALETMEINRDKGLGITVYLGKQRGNASTSDFSKAAIQRTVQAAYDIARFTAADPAAGLADASTLASPAQRKRHLDLYHPWALTSAQAQKMALACEAAALSTDPRVSNSDGASVSAYQSQFFAVHSNGFRGGYPSSRHSLSAAPLAVGHRKVGRRLEPDMQRDAWYSSERDAADLASPRRIGRYAAERALSRLGARRPKTGEVAVLFESPLAAGLLGGYVQAVSGGALYRKTTFLLDSMGKQSLASHVDIAEDPFVRRGKASSPFDDEGCAVQARTVVDAGITQAYFLGTYSARMLGLKTTGNSGGSHNLVMSSRLTQRGDDLRTMLKKLHRGVFVTEMMGSGVNLVTGDYSRGATGFWVENGEIAYPIEEFTLAGNLKDMLLGIEAIGADAYTYGGKTTGSVLIRKMTVAGV